MNMTNARPPYPDPLAQAGGGASDPFNLSPYPSKMLYASASAVQALEKAQNLPNLSRIPRYEERVIGGKGTRSVQVVFNTSAPSPSLGAPCSINSRSCSIQY